MRTVKDQHQAVSSPIADLKTYRAIPTYSVEYIDPFLFLNHHGPQIYSPNNHGLPFGPHPHRGFETVTFILEGDILHRDSGGHESIIRKGGVQWMTAGSGLIHEEVSSDEFKKQGGPLEILQLWVNLPAKYKMAEPKYVDLQEEDIPVLSLNEGKIRIQVVSGSFNGVKGAYQSLADVHLSLLFMENKAILDTKVAAERNIFFYLVRGKVAVNGDEAEAFCLVEFNNDGEDLRIEAQESSVILFGHARPFNEPVVSHGPFVMNSEEEIAEAYNDYRRGKLGIWNR